MLIKGKWTFRCLERWTYRWLLHDPQSWYCRQFGSSRNRGCCNNPINRRFYWRKPQEYRGHGTFGWTEERENPFLSVAWATCLARPFYHNSTVRSFICTYRDNMFSHWVQGSVLHSIEQIGMGCYFPQLHQHVHEVGSLSSRIHNLYITGIFIPDTLIVTHKYFLVKFFLQRRHSYIQNGFNFGLK